AVAEIWQPSPGPKVKQSWRPCSVIAGLRPSNTPRCRCGHATFELLHESIESRTVSSASPLRGIEMKIAATRLQVFGPCTLILILTWSCSGLAGGDVTFTEIIQKQNSLMGLRRDTNVHLAGAVESKPLTADTTTARAVLFHENPSGGNAQRYPGSAIWR